MNPLRTSWRMAKKDLKILFKDKGQLAVLFALPLILAISFAGPYALMDVTITRGGESNLSIRVYVVNEDQGPYGEQLEAALRGVGPLRLLSARSVEQADTRVADGEAAAAIIIPADFSALIDANQPTDVELVKDPTQQAEAQIVAGILNEALTEFGVRAEVEYWIRAVYDKTGFIEQAEPEVIRAAQAQTMGTVWTAVQEIRQNPAIGVQSEDLAGEQRVLTIGAFAFAAFAPMFATMFAFFIVGHMAESILREKEAGSFRRLLAAPIYSGTVITGKMWAFVVVVFLQMLLLFGVGYAVSRMPLGDSPLGLLGLTLALALAATGLGMLLGSVARTAKEAGSIGLVLGFVLFFASGSLGTTTTSGEFDLGFRSEGFRFYLSQLTPQAHAFDGYIKLMLEGDGLMDILPNILALLGFAAFFFLLGLWRFRTD
jgi:ABC-2 type transport system permease protein